MPFRTIAFSLVLIAAGLLGGITAFVAVLFLGFAGLLFTAGRSKPSKPPRPPKARLRAWLSPASFVEGVHLIMRLTNEQKVQVSVAPKTAAGNDAPIDGAVVFSSSDESVAAIEIVDDGSCYVHAVGPGAAQITATFDADLGDGVREVTATGVVEVVAAEAVTAEIVFGEPVLQ